MSDYCERKIEKMRINLFIDLMQRDLLHKLPAKVVNFINLGQFYCAYEYVKNERIKEQQRIVARRNACWLRKLVNVFRPN